MAARLNQSGREIWFDRVLWSYMPCNWKGWALIAAGAAAANAIVWLLICLLHPSDGDPTPFLAAAAVVVLLWVVAERHCP